MDHADCLWRSSRSSDQLQRRRGGHTWTCCSVERRLDDVWRTVVDYERRHWRPYDVVWSVWCDWQHARWSVEWRHRHSLPDMTFVCVLRYVIVTIPYGPLCPPARTCHAFFLRCVPIAVTHAVNKGTKLACSTQRHSVVDWFHVFGFVFTEAKFASFHHHEKIVQNTLKFSACRVQRIIRSATSATRCIFSSSSLHVIRVYMILGCWANDVCDCFVASLMIYLYPLHAISFKPAPRRLPIARPRQNVITILLQAFGE